MGCVESTAEQSRNENPAEKNYCPSSLQICRRTSQLERVDPGFKKYNLKLLLAATGRFSKGNQILENTENTPKLVYRCWLGTERRWVAVKRFPPGAWPDAKDFIEQAARVGQVRHESLLSLIGYCCEEDERLLVADFGVKLYTQYDTLEKHLFRRNPFPMTWDMRIKVALGVIRALNHCSNNGLPIYHDLNTYRVFLDYKGLPRLSCFGLMENRSDGMSSGTNLDNTPPEYVHTGSVKSRKSVVYSYGRLLLDLLGGSKEASPSHAPGLILAENCRELMDPYLDASQYLDADAKELIRLAGLCLLPDLVSRPSGKSLAASVAALSSSKPAPRLTSSIRSFLSIFRCQCKWENCPT